MDRCKECGLWKAPKTDKCPACGATMDMEIEGLSLSWKCRECDWAAATTAQKLCVMDDEEIKGAFYSKIKSCPYAEERRRF